MMRGRLRLRQRREEGEPGGEPQDYIEIDPSQLTGIFSVPQWLRDIGLMAWLLVGIALFLVGSVWLMTLTSVIVVPVIVAAVVAAVGSPIVGWLHRHRIPRRLGAALLMLAIVAIGAATVVIILAGITSEPSSISGHLDDAKNTIAGWLTDLGVDPSTADKAKLDAGSGVSNSASTLLDGVGAVLSGLSSLVFFLAMTALSLFFLLADGPKIRAWGEGHMGVPEPVARIVSLRTLGALRGYFVGVAIVAAFNAVVVTVGALILGVPLIGTIAIVTFFGAFIPYLGAWAAGRPFGPARPRRSGHRRRRGDDRRPAAGQRHPQQLVQPFAMGAALGIHPLAVLIVTVLPTLRDGDPGIGITIIVGCGLVPAGPAARADEGLRPGKCTGGREGGRRLRQ